MPAMKTDDVTRLIAENGPRGLRIARRLVGAADAEDAVQEALYRTHLRDDLDDPVGFFLRVLVNQCLSVQRRRALWSFLGFRHDPTDEASAETRLVIADDARALRAQIAKLSPMQRTVIELRYGEELAVSDIASALGVGGETVKTHLARALERLRHEMKEKP